MKLDKMSTEEKILSVIAGINSIVVLKAHATFLSVKHARKGPSSKNFSISNDYEGLLFFARVL